MTWLQKMRYRRRVERAAVMYLDHMNLAVHGFTLDEQDAAIDRCNEIAAREGWNIRYGKPPRTWMPGSPGTPQNGEK